MRKVIKKEKVRVDDTPAALPVSHVEDDEPRNCEPEVRVIRAEGRVAAIEYTCGCGERTLFELEYGAGAANPVAGAPSGTPAASDATALEAPSTPDEAD